MPADNRFFPLPLHYDVAKLVQDLAACEAQQWTNHFNQADYQGSWTGIALRSADGRAEHIAATSDAAYHDTPLLEHCTYFKTILSGFECPIEAVRLLALAPGSEIKTHRDRGLAYLFGDFRLHIPIVTDPLMDFVVDGVRLDMEPGSCWYANFDLPHSIVHRGTARRVHLVVDGKRNDWTDQLFEKSGYDFDLEAKQQALDPATKEQMIAHLLAMNTDTAREIIRTLL